MAEFVKRAKRRVTELSEIRSWRSKDDRYVIEEVKSLYRLPTRYLVVRRLENGNEEIVSKHRTLRAARTAAKEL
jgi:hypothetical protein